MRLESRDAGHMSVKEGFELFFEEVGEHFSIRKGEFHCSVNEAWIGACLRPVWSVCIYIIHKTFTSALIN